MIQMRKTIQAAILLISILLTTVPAIAMEGEPQAQYVLKGLDKVYVGVDTMEKLGLDRANVKSAIESRLSASGLKTVSEKEFLNHTDVNRLLVTVKTLKYQGKTFYALTLGLTEFVFLNENAERRVTVWAWRDEAVGMIDKKAPDASQKKILERVDSFIDLWQRANGKK